MISISEYKNKKTYRKIVKDIETILQILTLAQRGLIKFKSYIVVQEIVSVIETNKTLLELKLKDYEKKLKALTQNET